jgi:hypothetical protein
VSWTVGTKIVVVAEMLGEINIDEIRNVEEHVNLD